MTTSRYINVPIQAELKALMLNEARLIIPDIGTDNSDPFYYWADETSARIITWLEQINESSDANWIVTSAGQALSELVKNAGIDRAIGENDADLKQRFFDVWTSLAKDTPEYALLLARQADRSVADASLIAEQNLNQLTVYVADIDGENIDATAMVKIQEYMNEDSRHPAWLDYKVNDNTKVEYILNATVLYKKDAPSPKKFVDIALENVLIALRKLNTTIYSYPISHAMWSEDVVDIMITSPSFTLLDITTITSDITIDTETVPVTSATGILRGDALLIGGVEQVIVKLIDVNTLTVRRGNNAQAHSNTAAVQRHPFARRPSTVYHGSIGTITYIEQT